MANDLAVIRKKVQSYGDRNWDGALPSGVNAKQFTRIVISTISNNPQLLECDEKSLFQSILTLAQLGLAPEHVLGEGYLVPFKRRVQPIIGYRGLIKLARNSGQISEYYAYPVFKDDKFQYKLGLKRDLIHEPEISGDKDLGEKDLRFVYAVIQYKDGGFDFDVMTKKEIDKVRAKSPAGKSEYSPWNTHYVEMAVKTVIRKLSKRAPLSTEYQQAIALSENFEERGKATYLEDGNIIDAEATVSEYSPEAIADELDPTKEAESNL